MASGSIQGGAKLNGLDFSVYVSRPDKGVEFEKEKVSFSRLRERYNTIWQDKINEIAKSSDSLVLRELVFKRKSFFSKLDYRKIKELDNNALANMFRDFLNTPFSQLELKVLGFSGFDELNTRSKFSEIQLASFASLIFKLLQTKFVDKTLKAAKRNLK
jgi:hypothetical protein